MRGVRTIAIINQKGGVGKTTTAANLGAAIAARDHCVCLLDLDPQAHLTLHMGIEPGTDRTGIYQVLTGGASIDDVVVRLNDNLHLIPSVIDLAAAESELVSVVGREQILCDRLAECSAGYEYVMIDCPPSLGLLTLNALAAADEVFIPLQAHFLALQGLGKLLETVSLVHHRINPRLRVAGVVLCMHERNTRLAKEVVEDLEGFFADARGRGLPWSEAKILSSVIRRNIKLAECPSYGKTIFDYDPYSHGALDYDALAEEFLEHLSGPAAAEPASEPEGHEAEPAGEPDPIEALESVETTEPDQPLESAEAPEPVEVHEPGETPVISDEPPASFDGAAESGECQEVSAPDTSDDAPASCQTPHLPS